jgi:hypothetical protein
LGTFVCTTGSTITATVTSGTSAGTCTLASGGLVVSDTTGGSKTITATGGTSALTASTTYTVKPWAAFYNSAAGLTTYSFVGQAPTSVLVEVHGLAAGTVAANSITIGGVATSHAGFTIGSTGALGGAGAQVVVAPTATVPFGPDTVVVGGVSFNYAAGNIAKGTGSWGGVLISSIIGTTSSTGVAQTDASSYKPVAPLTASTTTVNPQNQIAVIGYGFLPGAHALAVASGGATITGQTFNTGNGGGAGGADANGAFFVTELLGATPWSLTATPSTAATYTLTTTQTGGPANVLSPSFGITPWVDTTKTAIPKTSVDYTSTGETFIVNGFGASDTITATIGGQSLIGAGAGTCTTGSTTGSCPTTTTAGQVPDLAAGAQNVVVTGGVSGQTFTATGAVTYYPIVNFAGTITALNVITGGTSQTTILRTGTNFGAHGLTANTAYSVVWNGAGGIVVGTFTSTATGGIPVPGVQITVPADVSGIHVIDIQPTASIGTSALFGNTNAGDIQLNDATDVAQLGAAFWSNYGDVLFNSLTSLTATPTVANVGQSIVVSGNGLGSSTLYDLGVSIAGLGTGTVPNTCALGASPLATAPNQVLGAFTSTSGGAVPSGASLILTDTPTFATAEQGTLFCVYAYTAANFGTNTATGVAQFELQASASLNMTTAPAGHNVILSAHALAASAAYNIVFNYALNSQGTTFTGSVVGAILASASGAGSATFTVPSTATGSNVVELVKVGSSGLTGVALANAPTFSVGQSVTQGCQTTSCLTIGSPSPTTIGGTKFVQALFTNTSNGPVTAIVYAVVHNGAGQTVAYSTATLNNVPAGGSSTAYNALFGLAPGTYSVTIFATSTSGTAISTSTPVSVTI